MSTTITTYPHGFTPVERNPLNLTPKHPDSAPFIPLDKLLSTIPNTPLVKKALEYLKPLLPVPMFNHSNRAYLYGVAIAATQFDWTFDYESYYLACLFHDLGATPENLAATKLSFEFYGAFLARSWLLPSPAIASQDEKDLADSVTEAICRHTNFIEGKITTHGQMIQLGTLFDNAGANPTWIHPDTAKAVVEECPRYSWTACFHDAMKEEVHRKPWSHTTFFGPEQIWDKVGKNALGAKFEAEEEAKGVRL